MTLHELDNKEVKFLLEMEPLVFAWLYFFLDLIVIVNIYSCLEGFILVAELNKCQIIKNNPVNKKLTNS